MTSLPEQFSAARKAQFEAQFDFFNSFANQALESTSRVVALNLATGREAVQRSLGATFALMNSKDPRDLLTAGGQAEEQMRTLFDYSRELFSIASGVRPFAVLPGMPGMPFAPQQAIETVEVIERTLAGVVADTVADVVAKAPPPAEPVVTAQPAAREEPVIAAEPAYVAEPEPQAPVMADTAVTAEPIIVTEIALAPEPAVNVLSDATADALIAEAVEPSPIAEPSAIASAIGNGSPHAAVAAHPASAPVEAEDSAEQPKITVRNGSSKRKK